MRGCCKQVVHVENLADALKELGGDLKSVVGNQIDPGSLGEDQVVDELLR